jgi:excisionase family DNA binding protein
MIEFRVSHLADKLDVHRNTIRNWIKSGKLKATATVGKRYRISEQELLAFCLQAGLTQEELQGVFPEVDWERHGSAPGKKQILGLDRPGRKPLGSVLVAGGGVAGIQAALDLADSGYYVYLIEKSAGIGGVMAQLDKTFPTNDCAM